MKPVFAKLALAAAALSATCAANAGVVVSSYASAPLLASANFGRASNAVNLPVWNIADSDKNLIAFCIEPIVGMNLSKLDYAASAFDGFANNTQVQRLYSLYYGAASGIDAAAKQTALSFQLALWEIYNDNGNTNTGSFSVMAGMNPNADVKNIINAAKTMISAAQDTATAIDKQYVFTRYASQGSQSVVTATAANVPEPGSIAMFGLGATMIGLARRRARRA